MKKINIVLFVFISTLACKVKTIEAIQTTDAPSVSKPNFIFYLADDQDQLDYGCYGNPRVKTSNVDKLASEGMRFTNFYTGQAICAPSRSQIYSGQYPIKNGCFANHISVKPNLKSITHYLTEAGYDVVLAGKSHVKPINVFDWTNYLPSIDPRDLPLTEVGNYLKSIKKPFCIFFASEFPHGPYPKTDKYTAKDVFTLPYDGNKSNNSKPGYYQNIEDDNVQLGKVLDLVEENKLTKNTMFIYTSDHGLSGKWSVKEEGLKVPFIVKWPGHVTPKTTSKTLLTFVDVLPTFLEIANAPIPKELDGKSFLKTLKGNQEEIHDYIYGITTNQNVLDCKIFPSRMVRGLQYKYIKNYNSIEVFESNYGTNPIINEFIKIGAEAYPDIPYEELYDLNVDPYQNKNLAKNPKFKAEKDKLITALDSWMKEQNDFLISHKMPLIKPTQNPLDKTSQWNKVPKHLEGKLKPEDYITLHY